MNASFRMLSVQRLTILLAAPCLLSLATVVSWADPPGPSGDPIQNASKGVAELGVVVVDSPGVGVLVQSVIDGFAADSAGISSGDFIMAIDGTAVNEPSDLATAIRAKKVGSSIAVDVWRDGQQVSKQARLTASLTTVRQAGRAWLGVNLQPGDRDGVRIAAVIPGSPAARAPLRTGDIVTMVGDFAVADVNQVIDAVSQHKPGDVVPVTVLRDGQEFAFKIKLGTAADAPVFSFRMPLGQADDTFVFPIDPTIPLPVQPSIETLPSWTDEFQKMKKEVERLREKLRQVTGEQLQSPVEPPKEDAAPAIDNPASDDSSEPTPTPDDDDS